MDFIPLHPKLVHLPIALAVLMPFIAGGLSAAIRRELLPARAWAMVVMFQALMLLSGLAAANTGESDEQIVEHQVPDAAVEAHEDAANWFLAATAGVLALSIIPLGIKRPELHRLFVAATVIGTVFVMFVAQRVGERGGELVYLHNAARAHIETRKPDDKPNDTTRDKTANERND